MAVGLQLRHASCLIAYICIVVTHIIKSVLKEQFTQTWNNDLKNQPAANWMKLIPKLASLVVNFHSMLGFDRRVGTSFQSDFIQTDRHPSSVNCRLIVIQPIKMIWRDKHQWHQNDNGGRPLSWWCFRTTEPLPVIIAHPMKSSLIDTLGVTFCSVTTFILALLISCPSCRGTAGMLFQSTVWVSVFHTHTPHVWIHGVCVCVCLTGGRCEIDKSLFV